MEKKKDSKRFKATMDALAEVFDPTHEVSSAKTEIYFKVLEKLSINEVEKAAGVLLSTRTTATFPKPAEIIEVIAGKQEDRAIQAWEKVDKAMRHNGNYASIDFGDSKIHNVIELLGGWVYLGTLSEDEWKWKRKEFESAYKGISMNGGPNHVAGLVEMENIKRGYTFREPLSISDGKDKPKLLN